MINYKADELYAEHGLCDDKKCPTCIYCNSPKTITARSCDYIILEGHRRPCPAGKHCTVYKKVQGKQKRKSKPIVCGGF